MVTTQRSQNQGVDRGGSHRSGWHDDAMKLRVLLVAAIVSLGLGLGAPHALATASTVPPATDAPFTTNDFIPENANIGDCVSSLPRPECGSDSRSGYHQYLTFGVLALGTAFIGWRIARGVRARDNAQS